MDFAAGVELLLSPPVGWVVAFLWGALWGSFFNVCIYRIAHYQSVVWPGSRCPSCGTAIAAYDNLPILSWLLLRGRCRRCKAGISPRYLLVELLVALLSVAVYARFVAYGDLPLPPAMARYIVYFFLTGTLVVTSGIDLDHQIIPDSITYYAIPLFFAAGRLIGDVPALDAAIGLLAGYGFVRLLSDGYFHLTGREGLGYGDGKLLAITGGVLGWRSLPLTLLVASLSGIAVSLPLLWWRRRRQQQHGAGAVGPAPEEPQGSALRHVEVPFGPFLAFGALCYLFAFTGRDFETVVFRYLAWLVP